MEKTVGPAIHGTDLEANEKGELAIPPKEFAAVVGTQDVIDNMLQFTTAGEHSFEKDEDGNYIRVGKAMPASKISAKKLQEYARVRNARNRRTAGLGDR